MNGKALLVVDVQLMPFVWKDYGGKAIHGEERLLANIAGLADRARAAGSPVVYLQYTEGDDSHRGLGKPLWGIHPAVSPKPGDIAVAKYHADPFRGTNLHGRLQDMGVDGLVITGVQTEYCVDTAFRTAYSLGYRNTLVTDGHGTYDSDSLTAEQIIAHHNKVIGELFAEPRAADAVVF